MGQPDPGFAAYVRGRQGHLLRVAVLLCGDVHAAEDLLQDALMKLMRHWRRVGAGQPDAYVRTVMYRDNIDRWKKRRLEVLTDETPEVAVAYGAQWAQGRDVRDALQQLPTRQRAVLVLRYFEDLTEAETARVLGIAVGTVKSQAHDGLRTLRDLLGPAWRSGAEGDTDER